MKTLKSYDEAMRDRRASFEEHFIENSPPDIILQNRAGIQGPHPTPATFEAFLLLNPEMGRAFELGEHVQQSVCVHGKVYVRVGLELECYRELEKRSTVSFELGGASG
jgi:hypothetical protein